MQEQPFMKHCSLHQTEHFGCTVRSAHPHCVAAQCGQNFFIPFLAELGNSKHFETYLFFAIF